MSSNITLTLTPGEVEELIHALIDTKTIASKKVLTELRLRLQYLSTIEDTVNKAIASNDMEIMTATYDTLPEGFQRFRLLNKIAELENSI